MISIIICSVDDGRFSAISQNYARLLKNEIFEIIRIPDAQSLCEGYARGVAKSRGDLIIFCHDDIEILNDDFADRLKQHLNEFDLIGVVGTTRLIEGGWGSAGPPYLFGQIAQPDLKAGEGYIVVIYNVGRRAVGGIQAVDGLFFAARRTVAQKIPFDSLIFDGFHLYDLDFSFAAHLAGFRLAVASDIHIFHKSWGVQDNVWRLYKSRFENKWEKKLYPATPRPYSFTMVRAATTREVDEIMRGGYSP